MAENTPPTPGANKTLSDRVRSLRLSGERGAAGGGSSRLALVAWALCVVLALTTVAFGYRAYRIDRKFGDEAAEGPAAEAKKKPAAPVSTEGADPAEGGASPGEVVLQTKGYIIPVSLVQVSPKVGGQLQDIPEKFVEGAIYKEGEVIAEIEDIDYKADYDSARATLEMMKQRRQETEKSMPLEIRQAMADLEESRENSAQLKAELERNRRLRGTNSVTQKEYEQSQAAHSSTLARIKRLEATLELIREGRQDFRIAAAKAEEAQAQAAHDKAKWRYENTRIRAPIDGMILSKKAEKGNLVNPSAFSSGISASLCEMADLTKLEVDLSVQERDVAQVRVGMPCQVMPEAYQSHKPFLKAHPRGYEGVVSRLMPTADRAKGAIPVRVRVVGITKEEAGKWLRPDMSALVSFLEGPAQPARK
jgi:multidrug resistance efflux pump